MVLMAGSYDHIVDEAGALLNPEEFRKMVENLGDAYETIEELYGMIWYLADLAVETIDRSKVAVLVEEARRYYKEGVIIPPH